MKQYLLIRRCLFAISRIQVYIKNIYPTATILTLNPLAMDNICNKVQRQYNSTITLNVLSMDLLVPSLVMKNCLLSLPSEENLFRQPAGLY